MSHQKQSQVVYIHPAKQKVGFPFLQALQRSQIMPYALMPAGIPGLANLLVKEGISVRGLNYPIACFSEAGFNLASWLSSIGQPRAILIDLHWYEHSYGALEVAKVCKGVYPTVPIVVGGLTASCYPRQVLDYSPSIDFVIVGDAEEPLRQLVLALCEGRPAPSALEAIPNLYYRDSGKVFSSGIQHVTPAAEIDSLNFVDLAFLEDAETYLGFQYVPVRGRSRPTEEIRGHWLPLGRGCVHNCSFCGGGSKSHAELRGCAGFLMRSPAAVADDIEELRDRGIQQVSLTLDPAEAGEDFWRPLFTELASRRVRIGLYNEAFQLPSEDFCAAFSECADRTHSQLAISALSGDEKTRRLNGKTYSNRELFTVLRRLKKLRMPVGIYYSANLPGQDESSLRRTVFASKQIAQLYPRSLLTMYRHPHTLDPCSAMSREPQRFQIDTQLVTFADYVRYCQRTSAGIPTLRDRGFRWNGRTLEDQRRMEHLWTDFARQQRFPCI